jgi:two-component system chemotaxis response regulator CheB
VGVVLTGANDDGSRGLRHIVDLGGKAIVQNPATSESSTMPAASIRAVPEAEVLDLDKIAPRLVEIVSTSGNRKHRRAG